MGKNVYANGMAARLTTSPLPPCRTCPRRRLAGGPVPIPYPNFQASDTANGTRTVKIGGDEVGQKEKSYYKTKAGR